jgi:acyl-CoA thioesterase-1
MPLISIAKAEGRAVQLVALGDSLTAGYLLPQDKALPAVLEKLLKEKGRNVTILNAGVSGDTTADGLARLEWSLPDGVSGVIVALGANDMLRGLDPSVPRANLKAIFDRLKERKIPVFILGMRAPANYGENYAKDFDSLYADLAKANGAPLYPFMLEGVAGQAAYLLSDGLHPNAEGVEVIARKIMPQLDEFVGALR